jgi:hypothetical protein
MRDARYLPALADAFLYWFDLFEAADIGASPDNRLEDRFKDERV